MMIEIRFIESGFQVNSHGPIDWLWYFASRWAHFRPKHGCHFHMPTRRWYDRDEVNTYTSFWNFSMPTFTLNSLLWFHASMIECFSLNGISSYAQAKYRQPYSHWFCLLIYRPYICISRRQSIFKWHSWFTVFTFDSHLLATPSDAKQISLYGIDKTKIQGRLPPHPVIITAFDFIYFIDNTTTKVI